MPDRPGVVFIAEDEDSEFDGTEIDHFFTGRFSGHLDKGNRAWDSFEDLSLDEALAWARERADRIVVRVGYAREYAIGFESPPRRPWPSEGIAAPERRRVPGEEWKDRTDADPEATWKAILALGPPHGPEERRRPEWDDVVASVADQLGARWSSENLDGWFKAIRSARGGGFATIHSRQYEIPLTVSAPTADRAREAALARLPELPEGWSAAAFVDFERG